MWHRFLSFYALCAVEGLYIKREELVLAEPPKEYVPSLSYTGTEFAPGDYVVTGHDTHIVAGKRSQFVIDMPMSQTVINQSIKPRDLLVWFAFNDPDGKPAIVFSAPVLQTVGLSGGRASGTVDFLALTPGAYDMHILEHEHHENGEGAGETRQSNLPVHGSPWKIHVQTARKSHPPIQTDPATPTCTTSHSTSKGRWYRCDHTPSVMSCLRDAWVYVPDECYYKVWGAEDLFNFGEQVQASRGSAPWLVIMGTSVARGTYHSILDLIGNRRDAASIAGGATISDFVFGDTVDTPGAGTQVKCWGWSDTQVNNLRLSFQDWRSQVFDCDEYAEGAEHRLTQVISENPDLIYLEINDNDNERTIVPVVDLVFNVLKRSTFSGRIALAFQKPRLKTGSIHLCYPPAFNKSSSSGSADCHGVVRDRIQAHEHSSPALTGRVLHVDEDIMSWSFMFDMERSLSDTKASQHFHYYDNNARSSRHVYGAVPEMSGQIFLNLLMEQLGTDGGAPTSQTSPSQDKDVLQFCFECPEDMGMGAGSCPNTTWGVPIAHPVHTLTDAGAMEDVVPSMGMHSCGKFVSVYSES